MRLASGCSIGLLLCVGACAGTPRRSAWTLDSFAGLLVSNSPAVTAQQQPRLRNYQLELDYPLLAENTGTDAVALVLREASAELRGRKEQVSVRCSVYRPAGTETLSLRPGQRARIDCRILLSRAATAAVALGDRDLVLTLPAMAAERVHMFELGYSLRIEDAS